MRILLVIEQSLLKEKRKEEDLSSLYHFVSDLIKKHEVWIACDAAFPEAVIAIRRYLKGLLSQDHIRIFHLPFNDDISQNKNRSHTEANRLVYNYFLTQFQSDLLISIKETKNVSEAERYQVFFQRMKRKKGASQKQDTGYKPTLAYFSPIFPAKSGIASYSSELLPYLSHYYEITLIVDQEKVENLHGGTQYQTLSSNEFLKNTEKFDRILYHFGNSFYHSYMWPILLQYPGVVVLHDFYLSGLLAYEELVNDKKNFWTEQLFKSHGYRAFSERFNGNLEEVAYRFPCNFEVAQHALGVIVHSDYSKNLVTQWYTINPLEMWKTIPLLREPVETIHKKDARKTLGLDEDMLLICSFGLLNATKLNHRLLQAFLASTLSENKHCFLIYVGEFTCTEYSKELDDIITKSETKNRIKITGWVDNDTYHQYLQAADIGVQLRTTSRGESSAAVLDCMNYGMATIVNANGSMADLPKEALYMLKDDFDQVSLVSALEELGDNQDFCKSLGEKAKNYIQMEHDPKSCASDYKKVIESSYKQQETYKKLITSIASIDTLFEDPSNLDDISQSISQSTLPKISQRQLLVDVSALVQTDLRTGIQRVVRAQLLALLDLVPDTIRVEPVYLCEDGGLHYRYAHTFTCNMLGIPVQIEEKAVEVKNGDLFYGLDFHWNGVIKAEQAGIFTQWSAAGVSISFAIYDLLPIQYPEFFPEDATHLHSQWLKSIVPVSDTLICISQAVADELGKWISTHLPSETARKIEITAVHLGSDIAASSPSGGLPDDANHILDKIKKSPTFLMVGTLEPRKGYLQTLAAFEILWDKGIDTNLVIVGNEGWQGLPDSQRRTIPETIQRLRNHPQLNQHLFWLEGISDLFLEELYQASSTLIAASEDEGFGLPLIEAAHHNLPVIARDIPIFREVAGDNAFYFSNSKEPLVLADAITLWLEAYQNNTHILSDTMSCITWKESAQKIIEVLSLAKEVNSDILEIKSKIKSVNNSEEEYYETKQMIVTEKDQEMNRLPLRAKEIYLDLLPLGNKEEKK